MTLKEFKTCFPNTYRDFQASFWYRKKDNTVLDRIYGFLDSRKMIRLNIVLGDPLGCYPKLSAQGKDLYAGGKMALTDAKKILCSKGICYLEHGFID
ncbi:MULTISPECIES: hypothetical protein [Olivibacter]|uniref:Uncharacterized protein n=1 Tax=Olivibacter jilunii TaxID=985016 RepID=A0ABW6B1S8_9SPHI